MNLCQPHEAKHKVDPAKPWNAQILWALKFIMHLKFTRVASAVDDILCFITDTVYKKSLNNLSYLIVKFHYIINIINYNIVKYTD